MAVALVTAITEASINDATSITQSSSIDVEATANSLITTTANSTPAAAAMNPPTLAALALTTDTGPQDDAAAIGITTLVVTKRRSPPRPARWPRPAR